MIRLRPKSLAPLLCLLLLYGCIKDEPEIKDFSFSASPEWGIPLGYSTIMADQVIENFDEEGLVVIAENGQVTVVYSDTLDPVYASDFLNFPDQTFESVFQLSDIAFGQLVDEGSYSFSNTVLFEFDTNGADRLDSVRFEDGLFQLAVQSNGNLPIDGRVAILDPLTGTELYSLAFVQQGTDLINVEASLQNALIEFINNGQISNGIEVYYELNLIYGGSGVNAEINIDFSLSDISIRNVGGYIAPRNYSLEDNGIQISMFNDVNGAQVRIEDPRINFYFDNGFGLGAQLDINGIFGSNSEGETIVVEGDNISDLPILGAAPAIGTSVITKMVIDNDLMTPSVTDFLAIHPNFMSGDFILTINPQEDENVFLSNSSSLGLAYEVEIPVYGSIANFSLVDTAAIALGEVLREVQDNAEIEQLDIRVFVDNALPLDAALQIIFTDSLFQPIDSLFQTISPIFAAAPVELSVEVDHPDYGRAVGSTPTVIDIPIPRDRILAMEAVSQMIVQVSGHTSGNGSHPIRLFESDKFDTKLAAKLKFSIDE